MGTIEIICTALGTAITVVAGVFGIFKYFFQKGMEKEHSNNFEKTTLSELSKINNRFDEVNHRIDKREAESKNIISKLEDKIDKVRDTVQEHTSALVEIYAVLGRKYPKRGESFAQKNSPRKLTELGKKIYNDINGDQFLCDNKEILFGYIDERKPLTRLDVEELAQQALFRLTNKPVFNYIKDYIYEAPAYKDIEGEMSELTVGDVCFILSIPLRDMYLKERNFK